MASPDIETARLLMRRFRDEDLDDLFRLFDDPEVTRFLQDGSTPTREECVTHLSNFKNRYWDEYGFGRWALIDKSNSVLVGYCGLRLLEGEPELAYVLAKSSWGKGLATEAARACLRYAFEHLGLERVVAVTRPPNAASRRVLNRLGMTFEGERDFYGYDCVLYSIKREDFRADDSPFLVREA
ncbi:MAG TPA: GNAT family N-acetyltransferase [Pyrinomonadaceae bacterium]|nr:GNAT family N-acetyltransferase [Pyrinomonadaceae bacterium]